MSIGPMRPAHLDLTPPLEDFGDQKTLDSFSEEDLTPTVPLDLEDLEGTDETSTETEKDTKTTSKTPPPLILSQDAGINSPVEPKENEEKKSHTPSSSPSSPCDERWGF